MVREPNKKTVYVWGMKWFDKFFVRLDYSPWIRSKKTGRYVSMRNAKGWLKLNRHRNVAYSIKKRIFPDKSYKEIFDRTGTYEDWHELMEEAAERYDEPIDYFIR